MADFWPWIEKQSDKDPTVKALKKFAKDNEATWPAPSNDLARFREAVVLVAKDQEREDLLFGLAQLHERWFQRERRSTRHGKAMGYVALVLTGLIIAIFLGIAIFAEYLVPLSKPEQARGLITFLFTFATIAIAVVLSLSLLWMEKDELDERFKYAKDLLMILVGILGTIIGFYFGTPSAETKVPASLVLASTMLSAQSTVTGDNISVSTKVSGGVAPYEFEVEISDAPEGVNTNGMKAKGKSLAGGTIAAQIPVPKVEAPAEVTVRFKVKDKEGLEVRSTPATLKILLRSGG